VTVTDVALLADTDNMAEAPALMEAGLAVTVTVGIWTVTVGCCVVGCVLELFEPHPASPSSTGTIRTEANFTELPRKDRCARAFIGMFPSLYASSARSYVQRLKSIGLGR
jgi:hypothetical protein